MESKTMELLRFLNQSIKVRALSYMIGYCEEVTRKILKEGELSSKQEEHIRNNITPWLDKVGTWYDIQPNK